VGDDEDLLAIGRELRRCRRAAKLSQEALAERAGLHSNYVGFLERGERNASVKTLVLLARELGVPAGDLFVGLK
jgi:transcriptional regulator with XRE-family HTH domain